MVIIIIFNLLMFLYINKLIEEDKRFQECNKIEQILRYRFYLKVPFLWLYETFKGFRVYIDDMDDDGNITHTNEYDIIRGKNLWRILISMEQGNMKWYWTMEEVMEKMKNR